MEALVEVMEQVGNAFYDVKLYPRYIRLCTEQDAASADVSKEDNDDNSDDFSDIGGALAAQARSTMVNAMGATASGWMTCRCRYCLSFLTFQSQADVYCTVNRCMATLVTLQGRNAGRVEE